MMSVHVEVVRNIRSVTEKTHKNGYVDTKKYTDIGYFLVSIRMFVNVI